MRSLTIASLAMLSAAVLAPAAAQACSVVILRQPSSAQQARDARRRIARASAVIDGEVVRALTDEQPALVRAARVLKGPVQEYFAVGEEDSCDTALTRVGERLRMILVGGPDVYFLRTDYSYARAEDRVLGSDRRRDWPYREGEQPAD
ncbi:MAG: hypothetical protein QOI38_1478 [Sphingomonadales bacterium]|nr:hypothetical protein [Sphingomonadales bacterium]